MLVKDCIELGLALADALAHLHGAGLVHRDIKPSNIIFVGGRPKLADIGLVTGVDEARSFVGTEGFIPPEGPGSPMADIFSLGKVLYEISMGRSRLDFPALSADWDSLPAAEQERLAEFNAVLVRACEVDPARRYQNAVELRRDLERLAAGRSIRWQRHREALGRKASVGALSLLVLAALFWLLLPRFTATRPQPVPTPVSIFVLPFRNEGTNKVDNLLRSRITDALIEGLAAIDGLKVGARKSAWAGRDERELRRDVVRLFGARHILSGRMLVLSNELSVAVSLYEGVGDNPVWSERVSGPLTNKPAIEEQIIGRVGDRIGLKIDAAARERVSEKLRRNHEAMKLFRGLRPVHDQGIADFATEAIERLTKVTRLDPNFAQAHTELAYTYRLLSYYDRSPKQCMPLMRDHALEALAIDDTLAAAKYWLAGVQLIYDYNWAEALRTMEFSDHQPPIGSTGRAHTLRCLGRIAEARAEHELNSKAFPPWGSIPGETFEQFLIEGDFARVIDLCQDMARKKPNDPEWPLYLGRCFHRMGRLEQARITLEELVRSRWNPPVVLAELGMVYARLNRREEALAVLQQMNEQSRNRYVAPYFLAQVHAALGDTSQALDQLEKAHEDRCEHLVNADSWGLRTDPAWNELQTHSRFQALLKKVGLDVWPK
jgi:TolB-like protein